MKEAIATVEIFAHRASSAAGSASEVQRWTLVVGAPSRAADGSGWACRVALADLRRPEAVLAIDSVSALSRGISHGRAWLEELESEGWAFYRDRAGTLPLVLD